MAEPSENKTLSYLNIIIYLISNVLNKAIPFLLLPVLTRYLSPGEYGNWALFTLFVTFLTPLIGMNMQNIISRNFFKKDKEEIASIISNIIIVLLALFFLITFIMWLYLLFTDQLFGISKNMILLIPFIVLLNMLFELHLTLLRNKEKPFIYGSYQVSYTVINLFISILLVAVFLLGWHGRAYGYLIASMIFGILGIIHIHISGYLKINIDRSVLKEIMLVSSPLIVYSLANVIINLSDRLFIDIMVNKEAVGLYTVGYTFGAIILLYTDSFSKSWNPWFYKLIQNNKQENLHNIVKISYKYVLILLLVSTIVICISYILLPLMVTENYYPAKDFIAWVAIGYTFNGMYRMIFPCFIHTGKTNILALIAVIAAIINMILNYILIKFNGPVGAAQSTLITFAISFAISWFYANKILPLPWNPSGFKQ
jgi:O-antigen/teichoic acid export membrane protein